MLDKLKSMFGVGTQEETFASNDTETQTQEQTAEPEPLTQDDLIKSYAQQVQQMTLEERQRYQKEVEELMQRASEAKQFLQQPPSLSDEEEPQIPEEPTVEDVINLVTYRVSKALEQKLQYIQQQQNVLPPAYFLVDRMVKQHPSLSSVAEDAIKMLEKLPAQYQTPETVEFIMWFLKGKRSEVEKKEAVAGLFASETSTSPANVTLPYSNEDIQAYAEAMGIDPKRFKMRLLEEMRRGGNHAKV